MLTGGALILFLQQTGTKEDVRARIKQFGCFNIQALQMLRIDLHDPDVGVQALAHQIVQCSLGLCQRRWPREWRVRIRCDSMRIAGGFNRNNGSNCGRRHAVSAG